MKTLKPQFRLCHVKEKKRINIFTGIEYAFYHYSPLQHTYIITTLNGHQRDCALTVYKIQISGHMTRLN